MGTVNQQDNSIINALKRLERAGSESSKATDKIKEAAIAVADWIVSQQWVSDIFDQGFLESVELPRGYFLSGMAAAAAEPACLIVTFGELHHVPPVAIADDDTADHALMAGTRLTRKAALKLSEDIATGWLEELTDWMEARQRKDKQATEVIEHAKTTLAQP
jgi:hypothetical protein